MSPRVRTRGRRWRRRRRRLDHRPPRHPPAGDSGPRCRPRATGALRRAQGRPRHPRDAVAPLLDRLLDRAHRPGETIAKRPRLAQQLILLGLQDRRHRGHQAVERVRRLLPSRAQGERHLACGDVARAELDPHGHAAQFPVDDAPPDGHVGVRVQLGADAGSREVADQAGGRLADALACSRHEHDDLHRRDARRQPQAVVVAVDHDRRAQQPGRRAPRRLPRACCAPRSSV